MTQEAQVTPTQFIQWKHAPGYVNVQVNQFGQVRDSGTHELLPMYDCGSGYYAVTVQEENGKRVMQRVHALVMFAFKGKRPVGLFIDHKDGDKLNNVLSNLHYVTPSQNQRNRKDQQLVPYNGKQVSLIEALEDMFGTDCVSAKNGEYGHGIYKRIGQNIRRGKTFDEAVQHELIKRGWPEPEFMEAA
jgi:hypothetical protein